MGARRRSAVEDARPAAPNASCADCHGDAPHQHEGRRGALSRLRQGVLGRPINLDQRINLCRANQQQATPLRLREQRAAGAVRAYVAQQSRGVAIDGRRRSAARAVRRARAATSFMQRAGPAQPRLRQLPRRQLGQAASPARRSRRATRPATRSTGWNGRRSGSLQRRLRSCMTGDPGAGL